MSLMQGRYAGLIVVGFQTGITVNVDAACRNSLYVALYNAIYFVSGNENPFVRYYGVWCRLSMCNDNFF